MDARDKSRLLTHVFATYNWLRFGMAGIAVAFPLLLWGVGQYYHGLPLQGSMSAYYWASIEGDPPMRVWFVGCIFAIGSCLFLYKGYTGLEDWVLNVAGVLVILVALFPMSWNCGSEHGYCAIAIPIFPNSWKLHSVFAIAFFACIWYVALFEARKTLDALHNPARERHYTIIYVVTSASLVLSPVAALIAHLLTQRSDTLPYFLEAFGILAFAVFWYFKSREMRESQGESQGAEEQVLDDASTAVETRTARGEAGMGS